MVYDSDRYFKDDFMTSCLFFWVVVVVVVVEWVFWKAVVVAFD